MSVVRRLPGLLTPFFVLAVGLIATPAARAVDPLAGLLADGDDPSRRDAIRERVRALGEAACPTLSAYAGAPDPRAREGAVEAMDDAGCDRLEDYRDFFADRSAWVVRAVARALGHHRIAGGVPFLLSHLEDRRTLVSDGDTVAISDMAERSLRRLTAQPIEAETAPGRGAGGRAKTNPAAWRAWYAAHAAEPPARWLSEGRTAIRAALAGGSPPARYAALETLTLVGEPVVDLLVEALKRRPGEITAALQCAPDEPPRVTEEVPCTLSLRNDAARRIPLALGAIDLKLGPVAAASPPPSPAKPPAGKEIARKDKRPAGSAKPVPEPPRPPEPRPEPERLAGTIVDLAPGQVLRRPVSVGPVPAAGRYEAIASFQDLGRRLDPNAFPSDLPGLEASLFLRFEQ